MPIYCPKCGAQNSDWAQTCQQCSANLPSRPAGQEYGQPGGQPDYQQPGTQMGTPWDFQPRPGAVSYGAPSGEYASIGKRFLAYLIDGLLVNVAAIPGWFLFIIAAIIDDPDVSPLFAILGMLVIAAGALGMWIYLIYLLGRDGATLGKRWMKITVVDPSGQPLGFGKAFLRELVKGVIGNVCFILWFWPLWDQEKQGLYDKLFNTHVYES